MAAIFSKLFLLMNWTPILNLSISLFQDLQELQKERALFENHKREELDRLEKFKLEEEKRLRYALL